MICILLSTYNGERYLTSQLESIKKQEEVDSCVLVRDDGSKDNTLLILEEWTSVIDIKWYSGENIKPAASFFSLLNNSPEADYYAFCDQDDVWLPDKLKVAESYLEQSNGPAMYFSQTQMVDSQLEPIETPTLSPRCNLMESITKSVVTGCTLVINRKLRDYLKMYTPSHVLMHDSWIYKLCMSLGGDVYFDPEAHILYRQHGNNVWGLKKNNKKEWKRRWKESIINSERLRSKEVEAIVKNYEHYIAEDNKEILMMISDYTRNFKHKCGLIFSNLFVGSTFKETFLLKILVLTNKF